MRLLLVLIFLFNICQEVKADTSSSSQSSPLFGDVNGTNVGRYRSVKFTNGSTTNNGDGSVTVSTSGSGGGSGNVGIGTVNDVAYYVGTTTVGANNNFTFNPSTNALTAPLIQANGDGNPSDPVLNLIGADTGNGPETYQWTINTNDTTPSSPYTLNLTSANTGNILFREDSAGEARFGGNAAFFGFADRATYTDPNTDGGFYKLDGVTNIWSNISQQNVASFADNGDVAIGPNPYGNFSSDGSSSNIPYPFFVDNPAAFTGNVSVFGNLIGSSVIQGAYNTLDDGNGGNAFFNGTTSFSNKTYIDSNGNVGIGTSKTTTAGLTVMNGNVGIGTWVPAQLFQVGSLGSYAIQGASSGAVNLATGKFSINSAGSVSVLSGTSSSTLTSAGYTAFTNGTASVGNGDSNSGNSTIFYGGANANSPATIESTTAAGTSDYINFKTGSQVEKMRIDTKGNVGIGSTVPGQMLDVKGTVRALGYNLSGASTGVGVFDANGNLSSGAITPLTGSSRLGFVATKAEYNDASSTSTKQFMSRSFHIATDNISAAELMFQNYTTSEAGTGAAMIVTASIEYPAGTFNQVKFSGSTSVSIVNGGTTISDMTTLSTPIPAGAIFWVRSYSTNTVETLSTQDGYAVAGYDTAIFGASGIADQTMTNSGAAITTNGSPYEYEPIAIIGYTSKPSILILGDSRSRGTGDTADTTSLLGLSRLVGRYYGYSNMGMPGDTTTAFLANDTQRLKLVPYATHVIGGQVSADLTAGSSAATIETNISTIAALFPTVPTYWVTSIPITTSTDSWATLANQTTSNNAQRILYNAALRNSQIPGLSGYLEIADSLESARDSGLWAVNGTANYLTADGTHPNITGYTINRDNFSSLFGSGKVYFPVTGGILNGNLAVTGNTISTGTLTANSAITANSTLNWPNAITANSTNTSTSGTTGGIILNAIPPIIAGCDANTDLLLHFDGTNGSTTFTDSNCAGVSNTLSSVASAALDTGNLQFGTASLKVVRSSTQYANAAQQSWMAPASQDFTISLWIKFNTITLSNFVGVWGQFIDTSNRMQMVYQSNGAGITGMIFQYISGGTTYIADNFTPSPSLVTGTWYHFEIDKTTGSVKMFESNGTGTDVLLGTGASTGALPTLAAGIRVGNDGNDGSVDGWIDEYKFDMGIARHSTNFPTPTNAYGFATPNVDTNSITMQDNGTSYYSAGLDTTDGNKFKIGTTAIGTNTRLTIDSSGNVGIGTATMNGGLIVTTGNIGVGSLSPGAKLDVTGEIRSSDWSGASTGNILCKKASGGIGYCTTLVGVLCTTCS